MYTESMTLDTRGLNCPLPILKTKKAITTLAIDNILKLISSDPGSVKDIASFCYQTGNELLSSDEENGDYIFYIKKT